MIYVMVRIDIIKESIGHIFQCFNISLVFVDKCGKSIRHTDSLP